MEIPERILIIKDIALNMFGHAISGMCIAGLYAGTELVQNGETDLQVIVTGMTLGAIIGFLKSITGQIEAKLPKTTAGSRRNWRQYFGL